VFILETVTREDISVVGLSGAFVLGTAPGLRAREIPSPDVSLYVWPDPI